MATRRTISTSTRTRRVPVKVRTGNVTRTIRVPVKVKTKTVRVTRT